MSNKATTTTPSGPAPKCPKIPRIIKDKCPNYQGQVRLYKHATKGDVFLLDFGYVDGPKIWLLPNGTVLREQQLNWIPLRPGGGEKQKMARPLPAAGGGGGARRTRGHTVAMPVTFIQSCGYLHDRQR